MNDLHLLPKVRDSMSYVYVEHCKVDQEAKSIAIHDVNGKTPIPCASLMLLMLGPGTTVTHAAIRALADNGCLVLWTGEEGVRMYAQGMGETRSARNFLLQAWLCSHPTRRLTVVMQMYRMRFEEPLDETLTLQQIRGKEGVRVREAYAQASRETGIPWTGRSYDRGNWQNADPVNRALSCANSCLYGVCHAAIVSAGYSPALGFVHTGKMLSFVYDIADLYKAEIAIPVAFQAAGDGAADLESRVRRTCRDVFHQRRLLQRIVPDLDRVLTGGQSISALEQAEFDTDPTLPGGLWDPTGIPVPGGINQSDVTEGNGV